MFFETLGLSLILIFLFYKWISKDANYFKDKNIKHDKFRPFVGSFKDLVLGKKSMRDTVIGLYKKYEGERLAILLLISVTDFVYQSFYLRKYKST